MAVKDSQEGYLLGVAAYGLWGLAPLYFGLLLPAAAVEIVSHRVVWSGLALLLLTLAARRLPQLRAIVTTPRTRRLLVLAAVVIGSNWATYIWGVNNGRVLETSLGYFLNPLLTVMIGVVVLRERLRRAQWVALGIGTLAMAVLTVDYGRPPWVALMLAVSFGTYGLLKKQAGAGAVESLVFETAILTPVAILYLGWLSVTASSTFAAHGPWHALLLASTGVVTALPLLCFGGAAVRLPMVTLGLLQYLAPTLQFLLGLLIFHETMSNARWVGFALVWVALAVFTAEAVSQYRRRDPEGTVAREPAATLLTGNS